MESKLKIILADISMGFSEIEYSCTKSLAYLIDNGIGSMCGLIAIQDMNLEQKMQKIKKIVTLKYGSNKEFQEYILAIIESTLKEKKLRNRFIHGLWKLKKENDVWGITCSVMKWNYDKQSKNWMSCTKHTYKIEDL